VTNEDRLGVHRVYLQAKHYGAGNVVGRPEIQGFVRSPVGLGATKDVFVTTSTFSGHTSRGVFLASPSRHWRAFGATARRGLVLFSGLTNQI